jgi:1,4-dihydroxy-2-naphthoate octaprenyltransferase
MLAFFASVLCLVLVGTLGVWTLLVFLALPRLWQTLKTYSQPVPESPPPDYPVWPLWYVAWAFTLTRRSGGLFVLGLILNSIFPEHRFG